MNMIVMTFVIIRTISDDSDFYDYCCHSYHWGYDYHCYYGLFRLPMTARVVASMTSMTIRTVTIKNILVTMTSWDCLDCNVFGLFVLFGLEVI